MDSWTYLVIVHAMAVFADLDMERTWMQVEGPFPTIEVCREHRLTQPESVQYSQCMPLFQAEGLAAPYNRGAFVVEHRKERS